MDLSRGQEENAARVVVITEGLTDSECKIFLDLDITGHIEKTRIIKDTY